MPPTMRPRTQTPRLVRSTWRSLDPNGDTSSIGCSQLHWVGRYGAVEYSGRLRANGLSSVPSGPYSSTADVSR